MSEVLCFRCRKPIDSSRSAFFIRLERDESSIVVEVDRSESLISGVFAMHTNGDRECRKQIVGYRTILLESLRLDGEFDISFLDRI